MHLSLNTLVSFWPSCYFIFLFGSITWVSYRWIQKPKVIPLFFLYHLVYLTAIFGKSMPQSSLSWGLYLQLPLLFLILGAFYLIVVFGWKPCFDKLVCRHYVGMRSNPDFKLESLLYLVEIFGPRLFEKTNFTNLKDSLYYLYEVASLKWLVFALPLIQLLSTQYHVLAFLLLIAKVYAWFGFVCVHISLLLLGVQFASFSESWLSSFEKISFPDFFLCLGFFNIRSLVSFPLALSLAGIFYASTENFGGLFMVAP